jgi:uncharacterized protein (DUF3084 family)
MIHIHFHGEQPDQKEVEQLKVDLKDSNDSVYQLTKIANERLIQIGVLTKSRDKAEQQNKEFLDIIEVLKGQIDRKELKRLEACQQKYNRLFEGMNIRIKDRDVTISNQHAEIKALKERVSGLEFSLNNAQVQEKEAKKHAIELMKQLKPKIKKRS